jgi:hypothetical protein
MNRRGLISFLFALLAPALAMAQAQGRLRYYNVATGNNKLLAGVALNAAVGLRTITLAVGGRNRLSIQVNLTRAAAATLTMSCKASLDDGATFADVTDQIITAGVGTLTPHVWTRDVSGGSSNTAIDLSVGTYDAIQCLFGGQSGGASDLIDVYAIGGAGP